MKCSSEENNLFCAFIRMVLFKSFKKLIKDFQAFCLKNSCIEKLFR